MGKRKKKKPVSNSSDVLGSTIKFNNLSDALDYFLAEKRVLEGDSFDKIKISNYKPIYMTSFVDIIENFRSYISINSCCLVVLIACILLHIDIKVITLYSISLLVSLTITGVFINSVCREYLGNRFVISCFISISKVLKFKKGVTYEIK